MAGCDDLHDNVIFESTSVIGIGAEHMGFCKGGASLAERHERILSYLPMSHIAGLMVDIAFPIAATASSPAYVTTYFARPYDLKAGSLKDRLCVARPTAFLGVPLVWRKSPTSEDSGRQQPRLEEIPGCLG